MFNNITNGNQYRNDMQPTAHQSILKIKPYKAGKSSISNSKQPIVKLSSNENPLGPSPKAKEAFINSANQLNRYPESSHEEVAQAIADIYNLPAQQIICGAGSDELISLIIQAYAGLGDEVLYPEYGFLMYKIYSLAHGATPATAAETNYRTDINKLAAAVTDKTKIVFIANPNNPTGSYITTEELRKLRQLLPANILLVIDNAYTEYVVKSDYSTGQELLADYNNVVILRTFSKIYGLPALRIGWGYFPQDIADVILRIRSPFNVNAPAQKAAIAAVKDTEHTEFSREYNNKELKYTSQALSEYFTVYPSIGNFIMVDFGSAERASSANEFLLQHGIIVRDISAYGLEQALRITIGTQDENRLLIRKLAEFAKQ